MSQPGSQGDQSQDDQQAGWSRAKKQLHKLRKSRIALNKLPAEKEEVPANIADNTMRPGRPLAAKRQVDTNTCSSPVAKHMRVDKEETDMAAWVEWQATEATNQLEYVSLQESIIRKSWAGWEEGMRLAHRQQEIGEAAVRMQTTGEQLTLVLKLGEGKRSSIGCGGDTTWGRQVMSRENAWMKESLGRTPEREKRNCI